MNKKINICLVDDDEMYLKSLVHQLNKHKGYALKTFTTGEALTGEMKSGNVDVVILDYYLDSEVPSAKSGAEILKEIKTTSPNTEVIMLSGQEDVDVAVNSLEFGAFDYVVKNKNSIIRVKNDIKRIVHQLETEKNHSNYRMFSKAFFAILIFIIIFVILYAIDPCLFGLLCDSGNT